MKTLLPFLLLGLLAVRCRPPNPKINSCRRYPQARPGSSFGTTNSTETSWMNRSGTCQTTGDGMVGGRPRRFPWSNGHLAISTLKDGDRYLDACVRTRGKFEHPTATTSPGSSSRNSPVTGLPSGCTTPASARSVMVAETAPRLRL